ncbi:MAG: hypothetical protein V3T59_08985 [Desulfobacterales bacterium]
MFKTIAVEENGHTEHQSLPVNKIRKGITGHQTCHRTIIPMFNDDRSLLFISDTISKTKIRKKKVWKKKGYILNLLRKNNKLFRVSIKFFMCNRLSFRPAGHFKNIKEPIYALYPKKYRSISFCNTGILKRYEKRWHFRSWSYLRHNVNVN